ncbi:MAG: hypothetical protein HYX53_08565 [Chloroflexi bacterium]|nr:hypothetical protein [Chloroflexota bacterium]
MAAADAAQSGAVSNVGGLPRISGVPTFFTGAKIFCASGDGVLVAAIHDWFNAQLMNLGRDARSRQEARSAPGVSEAAGCFSGGSGGGRA